MPLPDQQKIIGIVGGMGPMSGVLLQKLIIDFTKADTDQKHLPVITFTNPLIPDRTKSLFGPYQGYDFVVAIRETANALVQAGATVIGTPCNTSHARYSEIQTGVSVPIINMVTETIIVIKKNKFRKVGILATDGTIKTEIYTQALSNTTWVIPEKQDQENIMRIIYEIKAGLPLNKSLLFDICENLVLKGAECILLGCTELSLSYEAIAPYFSTIDSLRVLAQSLVNYSTPHKQEAFYLKNMSKNTLKTHSEPAGLELPDGSPNPLPDQADIRHTKQGVEDRLLSGRKRVDFSPDKGRRRGV